MVGKLRLILFIFFTALTTRATYAQQYRLSGSLIYGVPVYGSFFQDGYESRIGFRLNGINYRTEDLVVGGSFEALKFLPYIDNPISIVKANFYSLTFHLGYDIAGESNNEFEPFAETGYYLFRYNDGAFTGQSFGLSLGADYLYYLDKNYCLSLGLKWTDVFDKFGRAKNPNNVNQLQVFIFSLGLAFDL